MPKQTGSTADGAGAQFSLPADLSTLDAAALDSLLQSANAEMDQLLADRAPASLPRLSEMSTARKKIQSRIAEVKAEQAELDAQFEKYADEIRATAEPEAPEGEGGEAIEGEVLAPDGSAVAGTPQLVTAAGTRPVGGALTAPRETGGLAGAQHKINPSLRSASQFAPTPEAPSASKAIMTASVGLPGRFEAGSQISDVRQLGDLFESRARGLVDAGGRYASRRVGDPYGGVQVASIRHDFPDVFSDTTGVDVIQAYIERLNGGRMASRMAAMVAAGGWCAPSQIRYDFFNIACQDGQIDLPTFGVERGGLQSPISPSLADTFSPNLPWYTAFSSSTVPWLWTEASDILAVTGSPTKPCIRVPCSSMLNTRLECYGLCLTAGNLADNAWPEATRNFLRLLMAAQYHAQNARWISQIAALATGSAAITGCTAVGAGAAAPLLATAELAAWDYREKFGMCETDVLEVILPRWAKGVVRADLAKRTGVENMMAVPDSEISRWFDVRGIRAQFVADYQVRASGQPGAATPITQYPSTTEFLMYAAGTVARGNGMTLDLGVVRDSTLNATNDFTAAWAEECHMITKFGHEVRKYTVNTCPDGTTGAADLTSCCP